MADTDIRKEVARGAIRIDDFDEDRLQPASYDVILGNKFSITNPYSVTAIDPLKKIYPETTEIVVPDGKEFVLHPGTSVLGTLKDFVGSKEYLIQISGKSSLARLGLVVHNTAGIINPGHFLHITLELANFNTVPIILRPGMEIAQLLFSRLTSSVERDYAKIGRFGEKNWENNFAIKKAKKGTVKKPAKRKK